MEVAAQKEAAANTEVPHQLSVLHFRRKATMLACLWLIMATAGLLWRQKQLHNYRQVLHAIPEKDLVSVDLTTNPQLFSALISSTGKKILYGKPTTPVDHPLDFVPTPTMNLANQTLAIVRVLPPSVVVEDDGKEKGTSAADSGVRHETPPPPHAGGAGLAREKGTLKQWIQDARLPPRPTNVTKAAVEQATHAQEWAFGVMEPRPGTVLVGSSDFGEDSLYKDAVILLLKVCGCHPSIFGIILNAPSNLTMGDEFCPVARGRYPLFVNNSVLLGGPVGPQWTVLADRPTAGSFAVANEGSFHVVGSLADAHDKVARGELTASAVSFFSGYIAWPIARLEQEVRDGKWSVLKASTPLLRKHSGLLEALRARLQ